VPGNRQPARAATAVLALALAVAGSYLVWTAVSGPGSPPPVPEAGPRAAARATRQVPERPPSASPSASPARAGAGAADLIKGPTLPDSKPVRVVIPRLGVTSALVGLGLDQTGAMEVPPDPAVAGWYVLGPDPGALGPAVIAGHVTWNRVPAVFFRLATMRRGDRVTVLRKDGIKAVFSVTRVARFDKSSFPTRAVFGSIDHAGLRLITCGGRYDVTDHRYLANVVVFATLVAAHPATAGGR